METIISLLFSPHLDTITPPSQRTNQDVTLIIFIIIACIICLLLLFGYAGRVRSYGLHQSTLINIVKQYRKSQLYPKIELATQKVDDENIKLDELRRKLESQTDATKKEPLKASIQNSETKLEMLTKDYQNTIAEVDNESNKYANELIPMHITLSEQLGPHFYIEFGTVIVIIFTLLCLAVTGIIEGREAVTVLATIAGYVLGKATSGSGAKQGSASGKE